MGKVGDSNSSPRTASSASFTISFTIMPAQKRAHPHRREKVYIYGKHTLEEALARAPHALRKVFIDPARGYTQIREALERSRVPLAPLHANAGTVSPHEIPTHEAHQGIIGVLDPTKLFVPLSSFLDSLPKDGSPALALLDEVQDPHNVGAVIRSAAAFGLSAVLLPQRRQAGITGAVAKSSAGMVFRIPLVSIGNVNQTIRLLKEHGFWIYALVAREGHTLDKEHFDAPACFVLGNESAGIREKTRTLCDTALSIPLHPRCESLNVSAAAAVVFHAWSAQQSPQGFNTQENPSSLRKE